MKKLSVVAIATLFASSMFVGCDKGGSKELKSDTDSLAYAVGVGVGGMFKANIESLPGGDKKIDSIIAGFKEGLKVQSAYAIGLSYGNQIMDHLKKQTDSAEINEAILIEAFTKALKGDSTLLIDETKANDIQRSYMSPKKKAEQEKSQASSQQFLSQNKAKAGVITTPSGLQYEVITEGKGNKALASDMVKVSYRGTLIDGTEFDKGEGVEFPVQGVVPGFAEALQLMAPGSKMKVTIPSELGYGDRQASEKIKPNSILVFEVELLEIVKAKK